MDVRTPLDLGAAVRARRRTLKLSQTTVAEAAGVSRAWLAKLEAGKPSIEFGRVLAILEVLELTLDLRSPDEPRTEPPETRTEPLPDLDALIAEYREGTS